MTRIGQILLALLVSALPLFSQSFTGRILGTVSDPAGAVVRAPRQLERDVVFVRARHVAGEQPAAGSIWPEVSLVVAVGMAGRLLRHPSLLVGTGAPAGPSPRSGAYGTSRTDQFEATAC